MLARTVATAILLSASLCATWTVEARAQGVSPEEADQSQVAAARGKFAEARKAYDRRQFVDALEGFRASYAIVASPNTHLMIAHSLRELNRHAEAYDEMQRVVKEAEAAAQKEPKYEQAAQLARDALAEQKGRVGFVRVTVPAEAGIESLRIGQRSLDEARWGEPIAVDPGNVSIIAEGRDGTQVRDVVVEAGGEQTVAFEASAKDDEPKPPTPPAEDAPMDWLAPQRIAAYGLVGLGIASGVVSGVMYGMASGKYHSLEDACGDAACPERQDDIDAGRTFQLVSTITLIAGGVLVAGGVTLFLTTPDEGAGDSAELELRATPTGLVLTGRF